MVGKINSSNNDYVYYGDVKFNRNEVATATFKNGKHEVTLKTGQILIFEEQRNSSRNVTNRSTEFDPRVTAEIENGIAFLMGADLSGVTIKGSPYRKDFIDIDGDHNIVYTDNDNLSDEVHTRDALTRFEGEDTNRVGLGNNDKWIDKNFFELRQDQNGKLHVDDKISYRKYRL